jgi:uncharacterized delta-60 repeat protein
MRIVYLTTLLSFLALKSALAQTLIEAYKPKMEGLAYTAIASDHQGGMYVYNQINQVDTVWAARIVRIDSTGKVSPDFARVTSNGTIQEALVLSSGKLMVAGVFTAINNVDVPGIARLNADGTLDNSFHAPIACRLVGEHPNGKLLVTRSDGYFIDRMKSNGSFDISFNSIYHEGRNQVSPDGSIFVLLGGGIVKKYDSNGNLDPSFHIVGTQETPATFIKCLPSGNIILAGNITSFDGHPVKNLVMLDGKTGSVKTAFDADIQIGSGFLSDVFGKPNGSLVVGGMFKYHSGSDNGTLVEVDSTGAVTKVFSEFIYNGAVGSVVGLPHGKLGICGNFTEVGVIKRDQIAVVNPDLTLNMDFNPKISKLAPLAVRQPLGVMNNGAVVYGGAAYNFSGLIEETLQGDGKILGRLTHDGHRDHGFHFQVNNYSDVSAVLCQADDKILLTGEFQLGGKRNGLRLNPDGSVDENFDVGTGPQMIEPVFRYPLMKEHNGKIYMYGEMSGFNGQETHRLVALNQDGTVFQTFTQIPTDARIDFLEFTPSGDILMSGYFKKIDDAYTEILRLHDDGSIDTSLKRVVSGSAVSSLAVDANNNIYYTALGDYDNGRPTIDLIRLLPDGTRDTGFNGHAFQSNLESLWVEGSMMMPDGNVMIYGAFTSYKDKNVFSVAIISPTGQLVSTPEIRLGMSSASSCVYKNGSYYLSGTFFNEDYTDVFSIAKIVLGPQAPQNLQASVEQNALIITWDAPVSVNGYVVERAFQNPGSFVVIDTVFNQQIVDTLRQNGQYYYRVKTLSPNIASAYSTTLSFDSHVIIGPTGLTAEFHSPNNAYLHWSPSYFHQQAFVIERAAAGQAFSVIDTVFNSFYVDTIDVQLSYEYRVYAFDPYTATPYSNIAKIDSMTNGIKAPENLSISPAQNPELAALNWDDLSAGETGFVIESSTYANKDFVAIDTVGANQTQAEIKLVTGDAKFYYRVAAVSGDLRSDYSNIDSIVWEVKPFNVSLTSNREQEKVKLNFSVGIQYFNGYLIERSEKDDKQFVSIDTVPADQHEYIDYIQKNIRYYYRVTAFNKRGQGSSPIVSTISYSLPDVPTGLSAERLQNGHFLFSWDVVLDNNQGFIMEYHKQQEGSFYDSIPGDSISWLRHLDPDVTYYFRISAFNEEGQSVFSDWITLRWETLPAPPTNFQANNTSVAYQVSISWDHGYENEYGFILERSSYDSTHFVAIDTITHHMEIYRYTDILPGFGRHFYRMAAYNNAGLSAYTELIAVDWIDPNLIPGFPNITSAMREGDLNLRINWEIATTNEDGFIIEWFAENQPSQYDSVAAGVHTALIKVLPDEVTYIYIHAFNKYGIRSSIMNAIEWETNPLAPTNLSASPIENGIVLTWSAGSQNEDGFIVEQSLGDSLSFVSIDTVAAHQYIAIEPYNAVNKKIFFKVAAYNSAGQASSNIVLVLVLGNENQAASASVYPMPADDYINISHPVIRRFGTMKILSPSGNLINVPADLQEGMATIDIRHLPQGLFIIQYHEQGKILFSQKVIKK